MTDVLEVGPVASTPTPTRRSERAERERVSVWRMISGGISWALLIIVAALAIIVIVVPAVTGARPYTILTGSMEPQYPPGTLVVVRGVDPAEIAIGDVITYQLRSGEPEVVTHRVVAVQVDAAGEQTFVTQGDANNSADADPVRDVQVVGRLWYAVPYIGWINNVVTGSMRAWLIPAAAGALAVYGTVLVVQGVRERRRRVAEARTVGPSG